MRMRSPGIRTTDDEGSVQGHRHGHGARATDLFDPLKRNELVPGALVLQVIVSPAEAGHYRQSPDTTDDR
jgi:hypothetical protein